MMKRFALIAALCLSATMLLAATGLAKEVYTPKVDNFVLLLDQSGSMAKTHKTLGEKKAVIAQKLLQSMNGMIKPLDYKGALYTFPATTEVVGLSPFDGTAMGEAISAVDTDYSIFGRMSPVGNAVGDMQPVVDASQGKIAVILISDGEKNYGADPGRTAWDMAQKELGRLCFHVISIADSAKGQAVLDEVAKAGDGCGVSATAKDLMDEKAMQQFVQDVFYDVTVVPDPKPKAMPKPAPAPKPAPVEEVITFRGVNFAFDSAKIQDEMQPVLDEAADILKSKTGAVELAGHTDATGPEAYNQGLSERRAASVKAYLVEKGLDGGRITTKGYGESKPKYDNTTAEGRRLNRRVEITLQ